jgi:hypothetical protein
MRAKLKQIHSPDVPDLRKYQPDDPNNFSFLLELSVGPRDDETEDIFAVVVCTPEWLRERSERTDITIGRHHLIVFEYDHDRLIDFLERYISECSGETWLEIAQKLNRLAKWEFEDFRQARIEIGLS